MQVEEEGNSRACVFPLNGVYEDRRKILDSEVDKFVFVLESKTFFLHLFPILKNFKLSVVARFFVNCPNI